MSLKKKISVLVISVIALGISYKFLFKKDLLPQLIGTKGVPNFLLQPYFQAEPRVFLNGNWKKLPRSQSNIFSNDGKKLAVCGEGGLYIYDTATNNIKYVYEKDWYPCDNISFPDNNTLIVEDLVSEEGERLTFDIQQKKIIHKDSIPGSEVLDKSRKQFEERKTDFNRVCNQNKSCAEITNNKVFLINNKGVKEETGIKNAVALVGFKESSLFFATYEGTCALPTESNLGLKLQIIKPASACLINHHLHVYNTESGTIKRLLTSFRYDYEMLIFF